MLEYWVSMQALTHISLFYRKMRVMSHSKQEEKEPKQAHRLEFAIHVVMVQQRNKLVD